MSTSAVRLEDASVSVSRVAWQALDLPIAESAVRPLLLSDPVDSLRHQETRDVSWPSVIAQRAAVVEQQATERGFAEGERAGQAAARMRAEAMRTRLTATIDEIATLRAGMLRASEQDVVRLAIAIAERIVRREIDTDRTLLLTMARAAARKLGDHSVVTISMHPDDLLAVTSRRNAASDDGPIRLEASAGLMPGACIVQSSLGTIDVGLGSQIREILRGLLGDGPEQTPNANADEAGGRS
jgi:flagellar assembly protein FliH